MKITLFRNYNSFVILIWGMIGINFIHQYSLYTSLVEAILATACLLLFAYPMTTYLSTTLLRKAMKEKNMKWFILHFMFFSFLTTLLLMGCGYIFMELEKYGVFSDAKFFSDINSPVKEVINTALVSLFINFGFCGLRFFEATLELRQELTESQMEILKTQMTPHFMFNVLNHIHVLMQKDVELASSLLLQYSDILRYQLYQAREEQVTIGQEVEFMKKYIEVEKLRWKGKLNVVTRWEIENATYKLAPLLMITFIENAFKHVARSDTEKGYVDISLTGSGRRVDLSVENTKSQLAVVDRKNSGIGLSNIRRRLDFLYPGKYELVVEDTGRIYRLRFTLKG